MGGSGSATCAGVAGHSSPPVTAIFTNVGTCLQIVDQRIDELVRDPALDTQPDPAGWLAHAHDTWRTGRDLAQITAANRAAVLAARDADQSLDRLHNLHSHDHDIPDYGHDAGRDGPSFGR